MNLTPLDLVGALLGLVFTLLVFSYIFGDNPLFRLVISLFIGVASGYAAVNAWHTVLWPQLLLPLIAGSQGERLFVAIPLVLSALLLFKVSPQLTFLGNPAVAYLVGVGVATAIGGAVLGTLIPQAVASVNLFDLEVARQSINPLGLVLVRSAVILAGTLTTLIYFQFGTLSRPGQPPVQPEGIRTLGSIGQVFIAITLGMLFAGVYAAALAALVERIHFLGDLLLPLVIW